MEFINTNTKNIDLYVIRDWLEEEYIQKNEGFYCNWNIIERSFEEHRLISLEYKNVLIGFIVWSEGSIHVNIDIMEIHPCYRGKGLGKLFIRKIERVFLAMGFVAIKLFCKPEESKHFWQRVGFIKFPLIEGEHIETYYKPLVDVLEVANDLSSNNKLELWDVEPYEIDGVLPCCCWNLQDEECFLPKAIIQPIDSNWNIRLTRKGQVIKEDKVKYFSDSSNLIEYYPFLFITKL